MNGIFVMQDKNEKLAILKNKDDFRDLQSVQVSGLKKSEESMHTLSQVAPPSNQCALISQAPVYTHSFAPQLIHLGVSVVIPIIVGFGAAWLGAKLQRNAQEKFQKNEKEDKLLRLFRSIRANLFFQHSEIMNYKKQLKDRLISINKTSNIPGKYSAPIDHTIPIVPTNYPLSSVQEFSIRDMFLLNIKDISNLIEQDGDEVLIQIAIFADNYFRQINQQLSKLNQLREVLLKEINYADYHKFITNWPKRLNERLLLIQEILPRHEKAYNKFQKLFRIKRPNVKSLELSEVVKVDEILDDRI